MYDLLATPNMFRAASGAPGPAYYQQQADYKMDFFMDVKTFQYKGTQTLEYTNNSNDTLRKVFYHLYFNAIFVSAECASVK